MKKVTVDKPLVLLGKAWLPGNVYEIPVDDDAAELVRAGAKYTDLPVGGMD